MSVNRMRMYFFAVFPLWLGLTQSLHAGSADSICINFVYPAHGAVLKNPACTISVNACPTIESIHLSARYFPLNAVTDTIVDLGTIPQPPFQLIWNISSIPNQLFRGMGFIADGTRKNDSHTVVRREGVFICTKPIAPLVFSMPSPALRPALLWRDTLTFAQTPAILRLSGGATSRRLRLSVSVADPLLSATARDKPKILGADILIDPQRSREPFLSEKTILIAVEVGKKASLLRFKRFDDGAVPISYSVDTAEFRHPSSVKLLEGKGFTADITVPAALLGGVVPDSMGLNVVFKLLNRNGKIAAVSVNGASGSDAYCPLLWATLLRSPPGILDNPIFLAGASFALGLLIALLTLWPMMLRQRRAIAINVSDLSEEEKKEVQSIFRCIEQNVTQKNLSVHALARDCALPASKIESTIKKFSGQPFKIYVAKSRVEIAKERLRCSHSGEKSIAESCGFKNVDEMEKLFQKYCRTTPHKYRRDNQVA